MATTLDFLALSLLVTGLAVPPRLASLPALALGVAAQFFGNKWLAFRDPSGAWLLGVPSAQHVARVPCGVSAALGRIFVGGEGGMRES